MTPKFQVLKGKKPLSFRHLMALKQIGDNTFESLTPAWPPAPHIRAFGGHVYAQAMYAASKTVDQGFVVHQMTGYFILPGAIDTPFSYRVRKLRDGGIYCLRSVDVFQESEAAARGTSPCFVATISFKRSELASKKWVGFEHQNVSKDHLKSTYASVLGGLNPENHPEAPGADALWWEEEEADAWNRTAAAFPGVETRKVDMTKYNGKIEPGGGKEGQGASRYRQLLFYRLVQDDEPSERKQAATDLNLHAAAHLYASDKNSLFLIPRALGYERVVTTMASLSHTVVFHGLADHLRMVDGDGESKWFVQEAWTSNSGDNRACHNSILWDYDTGRVIGTTIQDGMIRFPRDPSGHVKHYERSRSEKGGSKL
ncbi:acyl-CoA thioesterase II [Rhinocladiella mackenziei CBS 650.93]|uniref:Rhinocladiella mackenziei CBS 650.93 unplaced genomic scaffold supercont1.2, whole genome shotgun sequence n=1 Tax=Rhinocladiella mackenziei CBS 650.93 TaxID=1442369 RepID=A0A0D2JFY2_9EURO|nr:acyl-CoA thioesterase II [Rhinocladiella mackenziei CBS 650.93]KIX08235.1 acyl-CoA thioesterase II [Rhinocladiella mackenziei CBS 650.93]